MEKRGRRPLACFCNAMVKKGLQARPEIVAALESS
jgi:hypothetical protein